MNENALKLIDAVCEAYDLFHVPKDTSGDGKPETFCNMATNHVLSRFGYEKFKGMVANQMVDYMRRKPEEWEFVLMPAAQELANTGRVLVAGTFAEPHGHVVVLRPGLEEFSSKWQMKAPRGGNVGGQSCIGKSIAWAFGGPNPPEIWMLKDAPSLPVV